VGEVQDNHTYIVVVLGLGVGVEVKAVPICIPFVSVVEVGE